MPTSKPILAAVATLCLLQGCATAPPATAPRAMKMTPLLQVQNSADQTAATYYQLGKFHQERGNKEAARAAYAQSIGLDRRQIEARNALAVLHSGDGRLDEAKALLTQLVRDYPRVAYLHNNLAYVNLLRGEPDAAIPALKNALALEPGNARALNNLGLVQAALIEKRNRMTAALGLAEVIVGRAGAGAAAEKVPEQASTAGIAATRTAPLATLAAASPIGLEPQSAQSRMEVVQVLPNVIELRQRAAGPAVTSAVASHSKEKPAKEERTVTPAPLVAAPQPRDRPFRFDVANGNGITGMAQKMRDVLAHRGIVAARVSNRKPFDKKNTEIFYVAGYEKEAERVRSALAENVTLTAVPSLAGMQDVQLVLGQDAVGYAGLADKKTFVAYQETNR